MDGVVRLAPEAADKRQARAALLKPLAAEPHARSAGKLMDWVVQLYRTAYDLSTYGTWAIQPTVNRFAAARGNSALTTWLTASSR